MAPANIGLVIGCICLLLILTVAFSILLRKRCQRTRAQSFVLLILLSSYHRSLRRPSSQQRHSWKERSYENLPDAICNLDGANGPQTNLYETIDAVFPSNDGGYCYSRNKQQRPSSLEAGENNSKSYLRPKMPEPRQRAAKNKCNYASPTALSQDQDKPGFLDVEQYADMSHGANMRQETHQTGGNTSDMYENMDADRKEQNIPLITETYVRPDTWSEYENIRR
eukprot:gene5847-6546_t